MKSFIVGYFKSDSSTRSIFLSRHQILNYIELNTLTSIQGFYRVFGSIPVGRLPGTIKGPFKSTRYCLED